MIYIKSARPGTPLDALSNAVGLRAYQFPSAPDKFAEYESYNVSNWDGEDADPILPGTIACARRLWQAMSRETFPPDIAPGNDGTIGFEWRLGPARRGDYIWVDIGPGDIMRARKISADGRVKSFPGTSDISEMRDLVNKIQNSQENRMSDADVPVAVHPVQHGTSNAGRSPVVVPTLVTLRAYEVYCEIWGEQEAMVTGWCRGGFSVGELVALLYARSFPKSEWKQRFEEATKGSTLR